MKYVSVIDSTCGYQLLGVKKERKNKDERDTLYEGLGGGGVVFMVVAEF